MTSPGGKALNLPVVRRRQQLGFRGAQVLRFIHEHAEQHGASPSFSIIRDSLGFLEDCHVSRVVARLEQRGLLVLLKVTGRPEDRRIALPINGKGKWLE